MTAEENDSSERRPMSDRSHEGERPVHPFGAKEDARVPEHGEAPRANDVEAERPASPDPDLHAPAAAPTDTDSEAGADAADEATGSITPLKERKR
ncbi:hypothetical protein [Jiella sp. M17.18]|uniref:hypothetical protein n=1 Tax=Jiella sp. M17.18 TaxID=3234247 RepID=UPI0034DF1544